MESIVGKILYARYRIVKELSNDDFSTVYLAEDIKSENTLKCQIERMQPSYDSEVLGVQSWQKALQEFADRGKVLKNISQHPQIPQLLAFFECDREFYLVRELILGESLQQQLERGSISENQAIEWLQEILNVLDFIHQAGIIHFNIQPSSLIEQRDGRKFLTDFAGIKNSILFGEGVSKTIANESFSASKKSEGKPSFSSDIYALGKTIIYALTGQVSEFIEPKSLSNISNSSSETASALATDIKPELADVLNKMVEKNPDRRYQSAQEVLAELNFEPQNLVTFPPPLSQNYQPPFPVQSQPKSSAVSIYSQSLKVIIWLLLALPFIAALFIVFIGINKNAYADFTDYSNDNYQFKLKYPQSWLHRDIDDPITGEVVVFTSPLENNADLFLEKLYVAVEYLPSKSTTLEQYSQTVITRIKQEKGNNIEVYKERKTKIDKSPARMIIYSRHQGGLRLRQMEVFTIKNNQVYIAIFTAERAKYSKFLDTAEKIIDSWEIE